MNYATVDAHGMFL